MPEFWLDHLKGARAGVVDHFEREVVKVGRNDEGDLILDEAGVSWDHAELRFRDGAFWVVDQNSTNGSYVNDERAHNAQLKEGDTLRFGKKGPVMRFRTSQPRVSESSGERPKVAPDRPSGKRRRAPSEPEIAVPSLNAPSAPDPSLRHSDLPAAARALPERRPSALNTALTIVLGGMTLAALFLLGFLFLEYTTQETELALERERANDTHAKLAKLQVEVTEREARAREAGRAEGRAELEEQVKQATRREERAQRELARKAQRVEEVEKRLQTLERDLAQARRTPPRGKEGKSWQEIEKEIDHSVLLIAVELKGKKKDGTVVSLDCFGTGFFASSQGHIVTNKHVVQPWKFKEMAYRIAKEGIEVDQSTYQISAWRGGDPFLRKREGKVELDPSAGFSTRTGTLELVRTAPDEWVSVMPGDPVRAIMIHDQRGNGDIAILRARADRVRPVPIGSSSQVNKLDEVLVVGFPAGPAILQAGRAETSPAKGHVRKVERTIDVTAPMIPGNSGGPLIDSRGRVIGICTQIHQDATLGSCLKIEHAMRLIHGGSW
ncbi:MAG: trypsin-like peptidase domain-containing protein [Planctomycetota bacterium]